MSKIPVTITLYMSEILYDVQNKTYLTGRSRGAEKEKTHEQVSHMQASDDEEDLNQILRSIGNAYAALKTKLSEYVDECKVTGDNIQIDESTKTLVVYLLMPSNFNMASTDAIGKQLHQFVVNMTIGDWFNVTNKTDADEYVKMATVNIEQIREAINKRIRPKRRSVDSGEGRFDPAQCASPVISLDEDNKTKITCLTEGSVIMYTTDGSTPDKDSDIYDDKLSLASGTTVKAFAIREGMTDSEIVTKVITYGS